MSNKPKKPNRFEGFAFVSQLTPSAVGALAVIGLAGTNTISILERHFSAAGGGPLAGMVGGGLAAGTWRHCRVKNSQDEEQPTHLDQQEPVVLVRRAADRWEIHAHGGQAVVRSIIAGLVDAGATEVPWGDWLPTADGSEPSLAARMAAAGGWRAAQILSRQQAGAFEKDISRATELLESQQPDSTREAVSILGRLQRSSRVGLQLPRPWRVVLVGPVNAGKSSLVNALAGYSRSLVSPLAGTTRDLLDTRLLLDGWEIDLTDTAGLREISEETVPDRVEQAGVAKAKAALETADLILEVQPATQCRLQPVGVLRQPEVSRPQRLLVWSKADLWADSDWPREASAEESVVTSAVTGEGVESLAQRIVDILVPEAKPDDECLAHGVPLTPQQLEQVVALQQRLDCQAFPE